MSKTLKDFRFDIFLSHASEDKDDFVRPLTQKLLESGNGFQKFCSLEQRPALNASHTCTSRVCTTFSPICLINHSHGLPFTNNDSLNHLYTFRPMLVAKTIVHLSIAIGMHSHGRPVAPPLKLRKGNPMNGSITHSLP